MYALLFLILSYFTVSKTSSPSTTAYNLWYKQPAKEWTEALPVGNGRLGAMVFGNPVHEQIQLNEDSMWPGSTDWGNPEGNPDDLYAIRQLLFAGKNSQADSLLVEKFSHKGIKRSHQTLGDLFIDLNHKNVQNYRRELDLNKSLVTVSYNVGENKYSVSEKIFASAPHNALIIEYTSTAPEGLNGIIRLTRPEDEGHITAKTVAVGDNQLKMTGEVTQYGGEIESKPAPILSGVKFETKLEVSNAGGEVYTDGDTLVLKNVHKALLYLVAQTSFYGDCFPSNDFQLSKIRGQSYDSLFSAHEKDYQQLFSRVDFSLGDHAKDTLATDQRLQRIKQGEPDLGLQALLFQYGRYLLISSSRPGTNPANLQGLWNPHIQAPWNADYHLNINLQMNYWPAEVTNLSELHAPLFDFTDRLIKSGKVTAYENYGFRGAVIHHASDLWAPAWMRAARAYWGGWIGGGGWLAQHYFEHYRFTNDTEFLEKRALPALEEVARFYFDWLVEDPRDGLLVSAPSTSPENRFIGSDEKPVATCLGSAMDQQIIAEVFDNYLKSCELLAIKSSFVDSVREKRKHLRSGLILGRDGRILEWDREYPEREKGHRHMSHLYAFHPGSRITKKETPQLFEAVRKTLDYRLANGGAGTGWSRAWLINFAARLLDGAMAHDHITLLLKKSLYLNLFDAHPPFQIDGNFGYTAGIAEMLLQSHEKNTITMLPALPPQWQTGHITGLKARGNFEVDIFWQRNELKYATVRALSGGKTNLVYKNRSMPVELKKHENFTFNLADFYNSDESF
ncbi:MAG: glycoside hydrolase family 95 protein [Calditrichaeota bacterium]|nr:MAG: glycoside hydrolase family 95 protein [Calditrichota bacterium]